MKATIGNPNELKRKIKNGKYY